MTSAQSVHFLVEVFSGKAQELITEITDVHMVWLEEIQQEANRMFSRDFVNVLELMPKTPSQKRNTRKKRVSLGRQEEGQARRRLSRGKRSNLRKSCVKSLNLIPEEESNPEASASKAGNAARPKRATRKNRQTKAEDEGLSSSDSIKQKEEDEKPSLAVGVDEVDQSKTGNDAGIKSDDTGRTSPPKTLSPKLVVSISAEERLSAELAKKPEATAGSGATDVATDKAVRRSRRSSVRCSLKLRHSLAGLRHSMTQEAVRRASRRSMLKRMSIRMGSSTSSSSNVGGGESSLDSTGVDGGEVNTDALTADVMDHVPGEATEAIDEDPELAKETVDIVPEASEPQANFKVPVSTERVTRSVAANSPKLSPPPLFFSEIKTTVPVQKSVGADKKQMKVVRRTSLSTKRKAPDTVEDSPSKRFSPPKKSQSAVKPNMRSFLHTVNKNQMLMMTPTSLGRTAVVKSFIKHGTPLRIDPKINTGTVTKERYKLEALRKKQEQEEERMKKMEEEKKKKQEELRRKREERIRRVFEAKVKEEQREEEKKKKIEQKMAHIEKNDKRQAEEKAKKRVVAGKRQEELEQKKKLEEEAARKKKIQQEEEKREQELAAKRKAEEEEEQARKELELKKEQERERERKLERERQAAAERERVEKEKALALRRELERAAKEREVRELEQRRKALEEKRKLEEQQRLAVKEKEEARQREAAAKIAANAQHSADLWNKTVDIEQSVMKTPLGKGNLNVTVDLQPEMSPQSYAITPKGGDKNMIISKNQDNYGMDQNSDDSTDDESAPRKPIPSWAEGANLKQLIIRQYFKPPDLDSFFGPIEPPRLESIFYKSKPRYFKRTSSAVWHSPPGAK
uniref:Inner centromere protein n=1 Tax=Fundulus heteroclitus TaxID=8078 RepID=A0A3Q2NWE2_FUNHE